MEPPRGSENIKAYHPKPEEVEKALRLEGLQGSPLARLPMDVILLIFQKLEVKDVAHMRKVCKTFRDNPSVLTSVARQLNIKIDKDEKDTGKIWGDIKTQTQDLKHLRELLKLKAF